MDNKILLQCYYILVIIITSCMVSCEISSLTILNLHYNQPFHLSLWFLLWNLCGFWPTCDPFSFKSHQQSCLSCHPSLSCHRRAHMIPPLPVSLLYLCAGQQVTRRRGWQRTWKCHIMLGSTSPRSSPEWSWGTWRRRWRTTTSPASETTAGKKSSKVCKEFQICF